jgi:hypothetical protein
MATRYDHHGNKKERVVDTGGHRTRGYWLLGPAFCCLLLLDTAHCTLPNFCGRGQRGPGKAVQAAYQRTMPKPEETQAGRRGPELSDILLKRADTAGDWRPRYFELRERRLYYCAPPQLDCQWQAPRRRRGAPRSTAPPPQLTPLRAQTRTS